MPHASCSVATVQEGLRKGFTLVEVLVLIVLVGILAWVAWPASAEVQDRANNATVAANVNTIRMALEQYATDHKGTYPTSAGFIAVMTTRGYMLGNRMPLAPWSANVQTNMLGPAGASAGQTPLSEVAAGKGTMSPPGSLITENGKVAARPTSHDCFGFIAYDYSPEAEIYMVYGTGKRNKAAITVSGASTRRD
jgi:general secretion pathway protein G